MLTLSLEKINARSPYQIKLSGNGSFSFTTDEGLTYEVGFVEDYMLFVENVYQFFLVPKTEAGTQLRQQKTTLNNAVVEDF